MIPVISVVGRSGVGKTALMEKLIAELKRRGYKVGTVKHDVYGFEIDRPGKDSWRHAQAGSDVVVIASPRKLALIRRLEREMPLDDIITYLEGVDIVLTEGYKREDKVKIEVVRWEKGRELLCQPEELLAIVTDRPFPLDVPQFGWDDVISLVDLIEERFLLR